jgi:hypothetical protein
MNLQQHKSGYMRTRTRWAAGDGPGERPVHRKSAETGTNSDTHCLAVAIVGNPLASVTATHLDAYFTREDDAAPGGDFRRIVAGSPGHKPFPIPVPQEDWLAGQCAWITFIGQASSQAVIQ